MTKVIVTIQTSSNMADMESLAQSIRDEDPSLDVVASNDKRVGFGFAVWEVIALFIIGELGKKVIGDVYEASKKWAKNRLENETDKRPKLITIFGEDGVPRVSMTIEAEGNVADNTESQVERFKEVKILPPAK